MDTTMLRQHLSHLLDWESAHAAFDAAVANLPPDQRGTTPDGLPYSPWQLVEHIRLAQADILAFTTRADYEEGKWPDDYWPSAAAPPNGKAWDESLAAIRRDLETFRTLVADENVDLMATVPTGTDQTVLREILLLADHTSYHVGQVVAVRRLLGSWPPQPAG